MGRIKEISRKSVHARKRNPVVYLICEGSETEIRYFKRFRSRGCNIDIIPISSQYKSADRLVQKAKATMGNNPYYPEDGDSIWCVFDRDDNSNEVLLRAKQSAQKEGYHLAYSNPSFYVTLFEGLYIAIFHGDIRIIFRVCFSCKRIVFICKNELIFSIPDKMVFVFSIIKSKC